MAAIVLDDFCQSSWHRVYQLVENTAVQCIPRFLEVSLDILLVAGPLFRDFAAKNVPKVLDGVQIRRIRRPFQHLDTFFLEAATDDWRPVLGVVVLLEDKVVAKAHRSSRPVQVSVQDVSVAWTAQDSVDKGELAHASGRK